MKINGFLVDPWPMCSGPTLRVPKNFAMEHIRSSMAHLKMICPFKCPLIGDFPASHMFDYTHGKLRMYRRFYLLNMLTFWWFTTFPRATPAAGDLQGCRPQYQSELLWKLNDHIYGEVLSNSKFSLQYFAIFICDHGTVWCPICFSDYIQFFIKSDRSLWCVNPRTSNLQFSINGL